MTAIFIWNEGQIMVLPLTTCVLFIHSFLQKMTIEVLNLAIYLVKIWTDIIEDDVKNGSLDVLVPKYEFSWTH